MVFKKFRGPSKMFTKKNVSMIFTIAVILLVLWFFFGKRSSKEGMDIDTNTMLKNALSDTSIGKPKVKDTTSSNAQPNVSPITQPASPLSNVTTTTTPVVAAPSTFCNGNATTCTTMKRSDGLTPCEWDTTTSKCA